MRARASYLDLLEYHSMKGNPREGRVITAKATQSSWKTINWLSNTLTWVRGVVRNLSSERLIFFLSSLKTPWISMVQGGLALKGPPTTPLTGMYCIFLITEDLGEIWKIWHNGQIYSSIWCFLQNFIYFPLKNIFIKKKNIKNIFKIGRRKWFKTIYIPIFFF